MEKSKFSYEDLVLAGIALDELFKLEYSDYIKNKAELAISDMFQVAKNVYGQRIVPLDEYHRIISEHIDSDINTLIKWLSDDSSAVDYVDTYMLSRFATNLRELLMNAQAKILDTLIKSLFNIFSDLTIGNLTTEGDYNDR